MAKTETETSIRQVGEGLGLAVKRYFTTDGVHPYEEIDWDIRDAVIPNYKEGGFAFEQRGVEFPVAWSQNATNIVAQKYFRGPLGTPQREQSVRQLIDRVADTITAWGWKDGYFADEAARETFNAELKHILVTQKAAFNSPVWFNVGSEKDAQCSACFILAVDDSMPSILNWYVEEGTIFKGGSGSGVNLSSIRSSRERLTAGGEASGPVSFMRGADASAGTIKSGGKTRRAAKMVILNVDHPDVEDFIWCKAREEQKARALRDAGFDMDLDGRDAYSIQYQNANNSVRVTDEFMMAYVEDRDWGLRAVTTGEIIEVRRARDLMRQMAQASWECADPGIQYDTTINAWHTSSNTGRINGSNPCSEYMHLDNSACNLASLNLMKFVDGEMNFDIPGFKHTVDVIFLSQEILVGNSSYPTPKIEQNAKNFRELGIGYANLGALLMARGLPYDSDGGRAWAGAITALLTGWSYRASAMFAEQVGPHAGFAVNREPMLNVIRKHRAAVQAIDGELVPEAMLHAAQTAWDDALALGEKFGYRNSQASVLAPTGTIGLMMDCDTTGVEPDLALVKTKKLVGGGTMKIVNQTVPRALARLGYDEAQVADILAHIADHNSVEIAPHIAEEHKAVFDCAMGDSPIHYMGHVKMMAAVQPYISGAISKCVAGETLIATEDGLVRIGQLHQGEAPDSFRDHVMAVASLDGVQKTDAFYYGGVRPTREVVLRSGQRVIGTPNHRLLVATPDGVDWRRLDEIEMGEYVAVRYGSEMWSPLPARFDAFQAEPRYGNQKAVQIPAEMTEELAFLLGAYASEGHTTQVNWTVTITNQDEGVLARVQAAWQACFGVEARIARSVDRCPGVVVASKEIVEFLAWLGCGTRASEKRIPDAILRSPRAMVLSFLQGLALDAYTAKMGATPKWAICLDAPAMLDDLQVVLTNLGIVHSRVTKHNTEYDKDYDEVYASGEAAQALIRLIPFAEVAKAERASLLLEAEPSQSTADVVPGIAPRELYEMIPVGKPGRGGYGNRSEFAFLGDPRTQHVSRRTLERVANVDGVVLPAWLRSVLDDDLHFSPVERVGDAGAREVFDVSVPVTNAFVANGIVNHNTINMPETATVEDVEDLITEGWRLGLKALAIYRDNCKVAQPLSADKKVTAKAPDPVVLATGQPHRKRLPKSRPSITTSFRVGDQEGYMNAGRYPDDGLGEIFLKVAKQGSTLSGITDALAISISIGLQYGVPLETYVSKFMNMKFEPSGMTDDEDIRFATSLVDYAFRRLAIDHLAPEVRERLGIATTAERREAVASGGYGAPEQATTPAPETHVVPEDKLIKLASEMKAIRLDDAPFCFNCGDKMQPAGSCFACPSCGATSGCS